MKRVTTIAMSWQNTVPQTYRTNEINKIATELSKLEQNATMESKLGLASRFENAIFTQVSSLNDYHKTIEKRLKKLKKNYKAKESSSENIEEEIDRRKRNLRFLYGDTLKFIANNGKIVAKSNPIKNVIDAIDKSIEHAFTIGAISSDQAVSIQTGKPIVLSKRSPEEFVEYLKKMEDQLDRKIKIMREWTLKYANAQE